MKKNKGGRPRIEIPLDKLEALMRMSPTLKDTAAFFKCHPELIENRIKEYTGLSFPEFREQNMVHSRLNLIRKALQMAESGNTAMVIFCLKNLCGWTDKQELSSSNSKDFIVQIKNDLTKESEEKKDE